VTARREVVLHVNGRRHELEVSPSDLLLDALHDGLGLSDVHYGCGEGVCGTCTVLVDGEPTSACLTFAVQAEGRQIMTASGLTGADGSMHPLQECFLRAGALQCGYCTPGMILAAYQLLQRAGSPTRAQIRYELLGNLCRCTGYTKIFEAIEAFATSTHAVTGEAQAVVGGASPFEQGEHPVETGDER
jgi:carbon-monoxide dehydrogenase small subunit